MLKKFRLKNYKNFKDEITIDFKDTAGYQFNTDCLSDGIISKMLIYGRNATGKTNLGRALLDIGYTISSSIRYQRNGIMLNADSNEKVAVFDYEFQFGSTEVCYRYSKNSNQELSYEKLVINDNCIFECDFDKKIYNFDNLDYINTETANIELYKQSLESAENDEISESKLPFLRWLINNVALKNDSVLIKLSNYIRKMMIVTVSSSIANGILGRGVNQRFYEQLESTKGLQDLEDFLNAMGIQCKLKFQKLPDGQMELYFAHDKLVPFYETASSGTRALVEIYRRLISRATDVSLIYLDEFDAFYHYEMAENVIRFFKQRYPKCQIIMTSHNTNLMTNRIMRPDCLFILSRKGTLTALCNATQRELREGHNLEKMYISGEFEKYE